MTQPHSQFIHPFTDLKAHRQRGPMVITKGEGSYIWDAEGNKYLEGFSALWCCNLGFSDQRLIEAAHQQMQKLPYYHSFGHKGVDVSLQLSEKLLARAPAQMASVFFSNSGSEANDTAVKIVWYYNNALNRPEKKKIIARPKSYHGVTIAAASLTGLPHLHKDFDLPLPQMKHVATPPYFYRFGQEGQTEEDFASTCAAELEALILEEGPETVAAFIAEPVMGAGGVFIPPKTYYEKIQAVLRKYDVLLIADEVVCAFGRTGAFWGSETMKMQPDMITCAKALTNAYLPLSATIISQEISETITRHSGALGLFAHGYTYTGHPVAAAVALENLRIYEEEGILEHAAKITPAFAQMVASFADHPLVGTTDSIGLMGVFELVADKQSKQAFEIKDKVGLRLFEAMQKRGVILRAMGDRIGFCPPLIVTEDEIAQIGHTVRVSLDELQTALLREGLLSPAMA